MYRQTTQGICVTVFPSYLPEQSEPGEQCWAYFIRLENEGDETVQLINRYWHITDGRGRVQEVRGPGVVGEQPVLAPGESYHYTSGVSLEYPGGIMQGHYEMEKENGDRFRITIPAFSLDSPEQLKRAN